MMCVSQLSEGSARKEQILGPDNPRYSYGSQISKLRVWKKLLIHGISGRGPQIFVLVQNYGAKLALDSTLFLST